MRRSEKNVIDDSIDSFNLVHTTESFTPSLPFLIDPKISDNLAVESIICRSILSGIDAETIQVDVSSYSLLVSGPNIAQTEKIFPFCVLPHSCECIFNEETSGFQLSASVSSIKMEDSSDTGSQPWLFVSALSNEEANDEQITKTHKMEEQDNESRRSCESDPNIDDDPYRVRPGYIWNKTSNDLQPLNKSTVIDSLPEDNFHSKDVVSRHIKQQQEEDRENKKNQVEKNRQECEKDDSVEYLNPDDFKPGGKYHEGEGSISDKANDMNTGDSPKYSLEAAERVFQNNVVNPFRNNLWLQLM